MAVKKQAAKPQATKPEAAKPQAATRQAAPKPASDVSRLIAEAAYYRAQRRGFEPGHELEDWIAAEKEVRRRTEGTA